MEVWLTKAYIERSMQLYRETRQRARELLQEVEQAGYDHVRIAGDTGNELVDVCRLTCLERGIEVINSTGSDLQSTQYSPLTTNPMNSTNPWTMDFGPWPLATGLRTITLDFGL